MYSRARSTSSFECAKVLSNKFGKRPTSPDTDPGVSPGRKSRRSRQHSARSDKYQVMSSDDEDKAAGELHGRSTMSEPMPRTDKERQYEGDEDDTYSVSDQSAKISSLVVSVLTHNFICSYPGHFFTTS